MVRVSPSLQVMESYSIFNAGAVDYLVRKSLSLSVLSKKSGFPFSLITVTICACKIACRKMQKTQHHLGQ